MSGKFKMLSLSFLIFFISCGETKTILKGNKIYQYVNNQGQSGQRDQVVEYTVDKKFRTKIKDKTDHYLLTTVPLTSLRRSNVAEIDPDKVASFSGLENVFYTSEAKSFYANKSFDPKGFSYYFGKFALAGITIPLKYRQGIGDNLLNPPTLETGFNVNFSPSYRLNWSNFNPIKKFLGSTLTTYSLTIGGLAGLGGTDLKNKSNAPGLLSDRKSTMVTYGGIFMLGLNSIGIGYAFGFDNVLGTGRKYWVYQNRLWHGVTVSVDLIK